MATWLHLRIPTEYEPEPGCKCGTCVGVNVFGWEDWRSAPGEVIHARFTTEFIAAEKLRLGSYGYAAQHQQRPAPAGGGMFRRSWWRFFRYEGMPPVSQRPHGCNMEPAILLPRDALRRQTISVDANFKGGPGSDFVAMGVWAGVKADRFRLDGRRGRWDFPESKRQLRALCEKWTNAHRKIIEAKANGDAIVADLKSEIAGLILVDPEGGKESRAHASAPQIEAGNVYLLDGAPWLDEYIGEFDAFPMGANDDQVDETTQALIDQGPSSDAARLRMLVG